MGELTVIAEAGVNHNGSLDHALAMVDVAAESGADVIKFQTFSADRLARRDAGLAAYQRIGSDDTRTQWDLLKGLELSHADFRTIQQHCVDRGISFLSTAFDRDELRFLVEELGIASVKVASGDLTFAPFLVDAGETGLPVILSTGMADLSEIATALDFIGVGIARQSGRAGPGPVSPELRTSLRSDPEIREILGSRVTILHCTTQYPAELDVLNIRAMQTIAEEFGLPVGYSDHSRGVIASTVAVALGAEVIEKHFTLDPSWEGPDHAASLSPSELTAFVSALRDARRALGSPVKECQPVERANRQVVRRSLVAARQIRSGQPIGADDLECRRPASGRSAFEFWDVVGTVADRDYSEGDLIA